MIKMHLTGTFVIRTQLSKRQKSKYQPFNSPFITIPPKRTSILTTQI